MSATAGKVALVNTPTALTGSGCPFSANVVDFVGYGATANCSETAPTATLSNTTAAIRAANGCTETDNNSTDFAAGAPTPRNTAAPLSSCGGPDAAPSVSSTIPVNGATGVALSSNLQVTFSEAVNVGATWFQISCATSGTRNVSDTMVSTSDNITFAINPNADFAAGEICTVTVVAAQVTDQDANDPPDNMAANFVWSYTTGGGPPTPIHTIQGNGTASPLDGQTLTTTGIVTLLRTGTNNGGPASGFFLQEPDAQADADPNTSEGILVFTSSVPSVSVGDAVTVTGTVDEFFDMTEITSVTNVTVNSTGNPLPNPVPLSPSILDPTALPSQPQLEKFEGMRMSATSLVSVAPNDNFFDVETVLGGVIRPLREPGIEISQPVPPDPTTGTPDCCIPRWDENPERLSLDTNARAGAPLNPYTSNVTFSSVSGPLDFSFARYRLIPDSGLAASANMSAIPVPSPTAGEFTVAGFNIENFNNNATQRQKAALAIRDVMRTPYIIGVAEIFELTGLQALATEINTISPGRTYVAHLVEADGTSADSDQDVGFLVDTSRVQINSVTQIELAGCDGMPANCNTYIDPNTGNPALLNDRPPLVLDANIDPSGANLHVIVVVNHLRSFIDIELVSGEGPRVRAKRKAQGEFLADLLQDLQTANPTTSVISVGDYNAFQFNDGYTDPIATIKGQPTADEELVVDQSPDLVDPNYANLIEQLLPGEQYSFIFEGTPQALDHVIVNTVAHSRVTRIAIARNNTDFPETPAGAFANDTGRPERCSDHDMPVAYFSLGTPQASGSFIISEYRLRGPGANLGAPRTRKQDVRRETATDGNFDPGARDEFIEFYNNTDSPITVQTLDGSAGWALVTSDGQSRFVIPNGTVIPARGHYLAANFISYSLSGYRSGNDGVNETFADPDITYSSDIPDGSGLAIFSTADPMNFNSAHRIDAVGYSSNDPLYREGAGFDDESPGPEFGNNFDYSFMRNLINGTPKDTNDNAADFLGIDTSGSGTTIGTNLGAPGPENLTSPIMRLGVHVNRLDQQVSVNAPPNRVRDLTPVTNGINGTLSSRRNVVNNTGQPVTRLRFRIKEITTFTLPEVSGQADIRALSSDDIMVTLTSGTTVPVQGTVLEEPPFQPLAGGWNSSLSTTGIISLASPLAPGASVNVQFLFGVQQGGSFRVFIIVEALP
jgi:predicted extracellular nuclease